MRGGRLVFLLFLLGLTLPFEGVIVPIYYEIRGMGLLNSRWAIILPLIGLFMPFGVFWMRAHFLNMPAELSEAARVDGATTWQLFWRIHVPLARPALASLGILLSSGPGTSSSSRSSSSTTRRNARWPGPSEPSRGSGEPTSRCCPPDRC